MTPLVLKFNTDVTLAGVWCPLVLLFIIGHMLFTQSGLVHYVFMSGGHLT